MRTRSATDNTGASEAAVLSPPKGKAGKTRSKKGSKAKTLGGASGQNMMPSEEVAGPSSGPSRRPSPPLNLRVSSSDDGMYESDVDKQQPGPPLLPPTRNKSRLRSCSRSSTPSGSRSSR